jgi:hypothetical protein
VRVQEKAESGAVLLEQAVVATEVVLVLVGQEWKGLVLQRRYQA